MIKTKQMKRILFSILTVLLIIGVTGCNSSNGGSEDPANQKVIAEYEGGVVTENEFNSYLGVVKFLNPELADKTEQQKEIKGEVLKEYIGEKYLLSKVDEKAKDKDVDQLMTVVKSQKIQELGSEEKYNKALKDLKISEQDLKDYLKRYYAIQTYFVEKEYNKNKEQFTTATVSHILVTIGENRTEDAAKKRAEEVLAKLKSGEDFGKLAKEYSDDPGSKDNGGTYENAPVAIWVPEFKEAALTLPINEISGLIKTDYGYHIMKVENRSIPKLDEISEEMKAQVMGKGYSDFIQNELPKLIKKTQLD